MLAPAGCLGFACSETSGFNTSSATPSRSEDSFCDSGTSLDGWPVVPTQLKSIVPNQPKSLNCNMPSSGTNRSRATLSQCERVSANSP
jgi:hypothetical protein